MSDRNVYLDLFAGLGDFSAAFEDSDTWEVTTVEIEERFEPDSRYSKTDSR
jgi:site-specific DNA-cytosine methylase